MLHLSWLFRRAMESLADWVVGGIEWSNVIGTERNQREVHTWTPTFKEDPL